MIPHKTIRVFLAAVIAIIAGYQLHNLWIADSRTLAIRGAVVDDAYFYSALARNFLRNGKMSMDGEISSNGFQPLWMVIQVTLQKIFPATSGVVILSRASWFFYILFCLLLIWVATGFTPGLEWMTSLLLSTLLLNANFQFVVARGLETPLTLCLLVIMIQYIDVWRKNTFSYESHRTAMSLLLGLLATLCFYSRTDYYSVSVILASFLVIRYGIAKTNTMVFGITVFLLVVPYLFFNFMTQASLVPISGFVKHYYCVSYYPTLQSYMRSNEWHGLLAIFASWIPSMGDLPLLAQGTIVVSLISLAFGVVWKKLEMSLGMRLFSLVIFLHLLTMYLFYRDLQPYFSYYFAFDLVWVVVVLTVTSVSILRKMLEKLPIPATVFIGITTLVLVATPRSVLFEKEIPYWRTRLEMAKTIGEKIPSTSKIGAFWPGLFAEFCQNQVIPLDGIIGSRDFFEVYVKKGKQIDYLLEKNNPYLVIYLPQSPSRVFHSKPPDVKNWPSLGTWRLWEHGCDKCQILSSSLINQANGEGWYLIKLFE